MLEVSPRDARNALSIIHGFVSLRRGMEGTLEFFHRHQCVQSDPIEVAGRNADLTLQSRVSDYKQEYLYDLLYKKRELFEYYCKMLSILPMEAYPIFRHKMKDFEKKVAPFFEKHRKEVEYVLKALEDGPVNPRKIIDMGKLEWGWGVVLQIFQTSY
ncbi:MAG: winged helix DNA-binding domain-containing protein [Methanomicrobia archaeon]|nr:winged helix DNA-binding domain-containing protein [Methanomicrobia archaeon]